jgi:hypothetical protein
VVAAWVPAWELWLGGLGGASPRWGWAGSAAAGRGEVVVVARAGGGSSARGWWQGLEAGEGGGQVAPRASGLAGAGWRGGCGTRVVRRRAAARSAASWARRWPVRPRGTAIGSRRPGLWAISEISSQTALSANSRKGRFSSPVCLAARAVLGVGTGAVQALELSPSRVATVTG